MTQCRYKSPTDGHPIFSLRLAFAASSDPNLRYGYQGHIKFFFPADSLPLKYVSIHQVRI